MTEHVRVTGWAVLGKLPGDKEDYRPLLGGSAPGVVERGWAGVPSTPQLGARPGPGQLPWVTFLPGGTGAGRWLAVTVVDTVEDRDAVGRQNTETRYLEVPFAELTRLGAGYQALHQAVPPVSEFAELGSADPVDLSLPGPSLAGTLTKDLEDPERYDRAARMAALLLDGSLMIALADRDELPLDRRLAQFDQVLGLLPFGLRAAVSLASWHDGTRAAFRLAFGKFPTRRQAVAENGGAIPEPTGELATRYLSDLREYRQQLGAERIIEHLARHRCALPADGAADEPVIMPEAASQEAAEILMSLASPMLVVDAVRRGSPSVERVRNVRAHASGQLDQASVDELDAYLLRRTDAQSVQAAHVGWGSHSARVAARVALEPAAPGRSRRQEVRRLYEYARIHQQGDEFLAELAAGRTFSGDAISPGNVAVLLATVVDPVHGELPSLRSVLLEDPIVPRSLLRLSLRQAGDRPWEGWLSWLDPGAVDAPPWLGRYLPLATWRGGRIPLPPRGAGEGPDLALIAACVLRDSPFAALAEEWWPALLRLVSPSPDGDHGDPGHKALEDFLRQPDGPARDPATAIRLDTLRLCLRQRPLYYPFGAGAPACLEYLDLLWNLWLTSTASIDVPELAARLLRLPKGADPLSEASVTLLRALVIDDRIPLTVPLAAEIAQFLAAAPGLADDSRLPDEWWIRVERLRPDVRTAAHRLRMAVRRAEADPGAADLVEIAVLGARAIIGGRIAGDIALIIGPWLAERPPAVRAAILQLMESVLTVDGAERNRSWDDYMSDLAERLAEPGPRGGLRRRWRSAGQ